MPISRYTFRKEERLISRKTIEALVRSGKVIHLPPVRLTWLPIQNDSGSSLQAAFAVPKRVFKNATDRNLLKRRMRESYRKNKYMVGSLVSERKMQYALLFVFTGNKLISYSDADEKIRLILQRFAETIQEHNS